MTINLLHLPEEDLLISILTKMTGLSFSRIRQANKQIHEFVGEKCKRFNVKANGRFNVGLGGKITSDLTGFTLNAIILKNNSPKKYPFIMATNLFHFQPVLDKWTGRVLKINPEFRVSPGALEILKPKTVIASQGTISMDFSKAPLDLFISDGLPDFYIVRNIRKMLFKQLNALNVKPSTLRNLIMKYFDEPYMQLSIVQAIGLQTSVGTLVMAIHPMSSKEIRVSRRTKHSNGQTYHVERIISKDLNLPRKSAVVAYWADQSDRGKSCCKIYFDYSGDLTPEMLTVNAIFTE